MDKAADKLLKKEFTEVTSGKCHSMTKAYWDRRDDSMFLVEFTGGGGPTSAFTAGGPSSYVCVNKAIGGWMIGTYDVSINKDSSMVRATGGRLRTVTLAAGCC